MRNQRWLHGGRLLAVALLLGGYLSIPALSASAPEDAAKFVGTELCLECHEGYDTKLGATPHGKAGFSKLSANGCETCHGAGSAHADDPSVSLQVTSRPVAEQNAVCQQCHDGGEQFFWQGSIHEKRDLACTTCHSVHSFKSEENQLKEAMATEQCFSCHKDVRADSWKRSHHPVREGKMSCTDCHNPHGAQADVMVRAASVNDLCYSCHAEKRGPFLWDHAPVREGCTNCHAPHGSNHLKLQKTSVPYLCQQCHSNTRHPGTLYDRTTLADGSRPSNRDFSRACLNCHAAIHGSNHPSGWALYR